jgi:hypothetical protein
VKGVVEELEFFVFCFLEQLEVLDGSGGEWWLGLGVGVVVLGGRFSGFDGADKNMLFK